MGMHGRLTFLLLLSLSLRAPGRHFRLTASGAPFARPWVGD